jgi:hypothetical protein
VDPRNDQRQVHPAQCADAQLGERAEAQLRQKEEAAHSSNRKADRKVTTQEAVDAFLEDEQSRHLSKTTTAQSKTLLEQQLMPWEKEQGLRLLDDKRLPVDVLPCF